VGGAKVNKAELIDALAERLGDRKVAASAVAGLIDVVVRTVDAGDRVTITGFGVFEKRARAARTARNPRTGQAVTVQQTDVPIFRPGALFREVVSGTRTLPATGVHSTTVTARPVAASSSQSGTSPVSPPTNADSRPATRVAAAARLRAVQVAPTKAPKAAKAAKVTDAAKASKSAKSATKAAKATTKTMKPKKGESKNVTKAPTKITAKKAVKKSAGKKSAGKKSAVK
jgi:DNA-binding protein HU-beta